MLHLVDKKAYYTEKVIGQMCDILQRMHNMSIADFDDAMRVLHNYQLKLYGYQKEKASRLACRTEDYM